MAIGLGLASSVYSSLKQKKKLKAKSKNPRHNLGCGGDVPSGQVREDRTVHGPIALPDPGGHRASA